VRRDAGASRERGNGAGGAQESTGPCRSRRDRDHGRTDEHAAIDTTDSDRPRDADAAVPDATGSIGDDSASGSTDRSDANADQSPDKTPDQGPDPGPTPDADRDAASDAVVLIPGASIPTASIPNASTGPTPTAPNRSSPTEPSLVSIPSAAVTEGQTAGIPSGSGAGSTGTADASAPNSGTANETPAASASVTAATTVSGSADPAPDAIPATPNRIAEATTPTPAPADRSTTAGTGANGTTTASGTGTPLPEGFTPVAASSTPAGVASRTDPAATGATATATSTSAAAAATAPRPAASADPRRGEASTPAAVARADDVNRTIAAGRAGEASVAGEAVTAEGVMPVRSADLSNRPSRPSAQAMPMPGAETAPQTLDEGAARTTPGVARGLDALARQRGGSLVMRLDPPSLGQLRLEMQMQGGRVSVLMTAAGETARSLLHDHLGSLRQALEDRGLAVDRLAVETAGRTGESSSNARSENRGDGQDARGGQDASGRQDAGDGRSRGRRDDASRRHAGRGDGSGRPEAVEFGEVLAGAGVSAT